MEEGDLVVTGTGPGKRKNDQVDGDLGTPTTVKEKRIRLDSSDGVSMMPTEIWFFIFSLIPSHKLLGTVGCVNHEW